MIMWRSSGSTPSTSQQLSLLVQILFFSAYISPAFSIPNFISTRQVSLDSLQLPKCALSCFLTSIISDGCANEADFQCHCSSGNLIGTAKACIEQGCSTSDEDDAFNKVQKACKAVGGGNGGVGGGSGTSSIASTPTASATGTSSISTGILPTTTPPSQPPTNGSPPSDPGFLKPSGSETGGMPMGTPPMPTDTPLALLPPSDQLSAGAKAGISVSVSFFAISVFLGLGWYIRRLKRELKAAQRAAAAIPDDIWQASIGTQAAVAGIDRQSSFGRGRTMGRNGRESPVSPLSPRDMEQIMTVSDNGYGVIKKKRGHVLSIVVEREEEDGNSMDRIVREPVPGQREGLSGPLELDGQFTGIVELPISITPRERSVER